jgi:hypothetical protein
MSNTDRSTLSPDAAEQGDLLLRWYGADRYRGEIQRAQRFWDGQGDHLASVTTSQHNYRQSRDLTGLADKALLHLQEQAKLPGVNIPSLFPDFGTVSIAQYWGGQVLWPEDGCKYIRPAAMTLEQASTMTPRPFSDPDLDVARALNLYREVKHRLNTQSLWLRTVDMQGVLSTAGLLLDQQELMMGLYSEPEQVRMFLERVCDALIEVLQYFRDQTGGMVCGNIWPYTFFPMSRGISFTEDLMPLLSTEIYRQFALPYLHRLEKTFGQLHIHCCGQWGHHARTLADANLNIAAIEFHYPFTRIDQIDALSDRAVFVPYIMLNKQKEFTSTVQYYRHLLDSSRGKRRFWFACADDSPESIEFAQSVMG